MHEGQAQPLGPKISILSGFPFPSIGFKISEGLPLVRIRDLGSQSTEVRYSGHYDRQFLLADGDILVGMDGDFRVVRWRGGTALLNQRVCKICATSKDLHEGFLFHLLQPHLVAIHRRTPQTTVRHLSIKAICAIQAFLPPVVEQSHIAEILDALVGAIEKIEQTIAKLRDVRLGLLQDLLTRGIDENGYLRDSSRHTGKFTDSPVGRIPKAWRVSDVGSEFEIVSGITLGPHRKPSNYPQPYIRVANVHRLRLDLDDIAYLEAMPSELVGRTLEIGDLLIIEGHADPKEIGRCAMACSEVVGFTFQNHIFRLRPHSLRSSFALQWLNGNWVQGYWRRHCSTSSGLNTINRKQLAALPVVIPPSQEQKRIETILDGLAHRIGCEEKLLAKLRALRLGLMDDLLSGSVRVPTLG